MLLKNKIKGCYPMRIEEIVFNDGSLLRDKEAIICGDFLIVDNGGDEAPTMYNLMTVSELRRVEEIRSLRELRSGY